jgi:hypothetical protein
MGKRGLGSGESEETFYYLPQGQKGKVALKIFGFQGSEKAALNAFMVVVLVCRIVCYAMIVRMMIPHFSLSQVDLPLCMNVGV